MRRAAKRLVSDVTSRKNKEAKFQSSGCPLRRPSWHARTNERENTALRARATDGFARTICGAVIAPNPSDARLRINDLIVAMRLHKRPGCRALQNL